MSRKKTTYQRGELMVKVREGYAVHEPRHGTICMTCEDEPIPESVARKRYPGQWHKFEASSFDEDRKPFATDRSVQNEEKERLALRKAKDVEDQDPVFHPPV